MKADLSTSAEDATQEAVTAYLRAHPALLAERPALYGVLAPPERVHGVTLTDHMAAMLRAARLRVAELEARSLAMLEGRRAASGAAERVQEAVLAVLRSDDPAECVTDLFPGLLGVDAASLCCEGFSPRWRSLPPGAVQTLTQGRAVVFRDRPADAMLLHAEAELLAERDVLLRLDLPRPSLLALVARDPAMLPSMEGAAHFRFLGAALSARLGM